MTIRLIISELMADIRQKSRLECEAIEDPKARYKAEAGVDKSDELCRTIISVSSSLAKKLHRYLEDFYQDEAQDQLGLPVDLVYEISCGERRMMGKAQMLADAMHDYIVHFTLARYYATVGQEALSNKHSILTADVAGQIDAMIYNKKEPQI